MERLKEDTLHKTSLVDWLLMAIAVASAFAISIYGLSSMFRLVVR